MDLKGWLIFFFVFWRLKYQPCVN